VRGDGSGDGDNAGSGYVCGVTGGGGGSVLIMYMRVFDTTNNTESFCITLEIYDLQ
jgi:hypothetical protein